MPAIQILSQEEIDAFDLPPQFSGTERKKYFNVTKQIRKSIGKLRSSHTKVGFLIQLGYFKATGRFFPPVNIRMEDIRYASVILELPANDIRGIYTHDTYHHHKQVILQLMGFVSIENGKHYLDSHLNTLIVSHLPAKKIFFSLLDWLRVQKIETPTYHYLRHMITQQLIAHQTLLDETLKFQLKDYQASVLDELMIQESQFPHAYRLTKLKHASQSEKPGKITESMVFFKDVKQRFKLLEPIIVLLDFPVDTWRAYANWIMRTRTNQLIELGNHYSRYLYLIAFLYHQYIFRQDCFIRILLNATNKIIGQVKEYRKEMDDQQRETKSEYIKATKDAKDFYRNKWMATCAIVEQSELDPNEKIGQLMLLIDGEIGMEPDNDPEYRKLEYELESANSRKPKYEVLAKRFVFLKNRVSHIIREVEFDEKSSSGTLIKAIKGYRTFDPKEFVASVLPILENDAPHLYSQRGKPMMGLIKALFYMKVAEGIKAGTLNLKYSYKYRAVEEYLIPEKKWKTEKEALLKEAGLEPFKSFEHVSTELSKQLDRQYERTNKNIAEGKNKHASINTNGKVIIATPGVDRPDQDSVAGLLEQFKFKPIADLLFEVNGTTNFMSCFQHRNIKNQKPRPNMDVFLAGLIGYGCNIGINKMAQISRGINESTLHNTMKWYFSVEHLRQANDQIVNLIHKMPIRELFRHDDLTNRTSSDGQRFDMGVESLNASLSYKYPGMRKGTAVYSFADQAIAIFYTTVILTADRESTYVLDGLMHNEVYWQEDKPWFHHTDTHGQTEVMFAAANLLGISLAPRIKNLKTQVLYTFEKPSLYANKGYVLKPKLGIDADIVRQEWDAMLRVMASIRLKHSTASAIFSRLTSYAKQHPLYQAFKEMGKIYRSLYILKYYDELKLRQMTEKQLNKVERSHQFAKAIFFDNNREIQQELKEDQDIAVNCRVLIQNSIILWNCLTLSELYQKEKEVKEREKMMGIFRGGSACTWQHINLQGIYEFSLELEPKISSQKIKQILDFKFEV
jgi:TnpA family transposase